ncbi:MAG: hypothetical protein I8H66_02910 [Sphingobacteriia bacterium]|nr:hypothetical protein [Sphingobacteriia bacterium]
MENNNQKDRSRRGFLSLLVPGKGANISTDGKENPEMVKMLTADGRLVEVEKSILEAASKKIKSSNQEIYQWMNNPSKENNR